MSFYRDTQMRTKILPLEFSVFNLSFLTEHWIFKIAFLNSLESTYYFYLHIKTESKFNVVIPLTNWLYWAPAQSPALQRCALTSYKTESSSDLYTNFSEGLSRQTSHQNEKKDLRKRKVDAHKAGDGYTKLSLGFKTGIRSMIEKLKENHTAHK